MTGFTSYFTLGLQHISDLQAYDHIVFLVALVAIYTFRDWKKVIWLVTAFTIGHSLTLALAAIGWIPVNVGLIEFLIPVTILITGLYNIVKKDHANIRVKYLIALIFGLIHGMGFSNFFRSLLGTKTDITVPLLAFNLGVEAGQIVIVIIALILSYLVVTKMQWINRRDWTVLLSGAAVGISLILIQQTAFW